MYIFVIVLLLLFYFLTNIEEFMNFGIPTRNTRGMSYDIRCVLKIKKRYTPWGYGTINPNHYGKCL